MLRWDFGLMFRHVRYVAGGAIFLAASVAVAYDIMVIN